jgi:hypothetical protein
VVKERPTQPTEIAMSADRDRGTRRQKQKRAKQQKRDLREQRPPAGASAAPATKQAA